MPVVAEMIHDPEANYLPGEVVEPSKGATDDFTQEPVLIFPADLDTLTYAEPDTDLDKSQPNAHLEEAVSAATASNATASKLARGLIHLIYAVPPADLGKLDYRVIIPRIVRKRFPNLKQDTLDGVMQNAYDSVANDYNSEQERLFVEISARYAPQVTERPIGGVDEYHLARAFWYDWLTGRCNYPGQHPQALIESTLLHQGAHPIEAEYIADLGIQGARKLIHDSSVLMGKYRVLIQ